MGARRRPRPRWVIMAAAAAAVGMASGSNPLIEHWDGTRWSAQVQPEILGAFPAVAAMTPIDAWAVGLYYNRPDTLIEHWDGSSWQAVPAPSPGTEENVLNGVVAISSTDVWAVGYYEDPGSLTSLFLHWDGATWTLFPS